MPFMGTRGGGSVRGFGRFGLRPPLPPTAASATASLPGKNTASISFTAPVDPTITGYTVTSSPGNLTASGSASPITISGLTPGQAYTFSVVSNAGSLNSSPVSTGSITNPNSTPVTGGVIYYDNTYVYHIFRSNGTLATNSASITADYALIGGGGGNGTSGFGGGGGGGGFTSSTFTMSSSSTKSITIGAAGVTNNAPNAPVSGGNSTATGLPTAIGGGAGGYSGDRNGQSGGSGGGAAQSGTPGTGTAGQGNSGGTGGTYGKGGGGAGAAGSAGMGGQGTSSIASWIQAFAVYNNLTSGSSWSLVPGDNNFGNLGSTWYVSGGHPDGVGGGSPYGYADGNSHDAAGGYGTPGGGGGANGAFFIRYPRSQVGV